VPDPRVPDSHRDLLERPLFAHLATVRPNGAPQSNVMWYVWDGNRIKMTHTKSRQKFRNLQRDPRLALSIADPEDMYRFIEVRGELESVVDDDAQASFYQSLQRRYGQTYEIRDAAERVILTIRPTVFVVADGGRARRAAANL
jgi:PPOX class probable F420-dependent enzyme